MAALVSVVIPVFNAGHFLPTTLQSVDEQDYPNLEIIVIDDGSIDGSWDTVKRFARAASKPVKLVTHPLRRNCGIAASYRLALQHCGGRYIAFLEHDDLWGTNKISHQIRVFETFPEVGVVFSNIYLCDERGVIAPKPFTSLLNKPPAQQPFDAFYKLLWGNFVASFSNVMVRYDQVNISDIISEPDGFQDWMFLLALAPRCKFYYCPDITTIWRRRDQGHYTQVRNLADFRKRRKLALINALEKILKDRQTLTPMPRYALRIYKNSWYLLISILNGSEKIAETIRLRTTRYL